MGIAHFWMEVSSASFNTMGAASRYFMLVVKFAAVMAVTNHGWVAVVAATMTCTAAVSWQKDGMPQQCGQRTRDLLLPKDCSQHGGQISRVAMELWPRG